MRTVLLLSAALLMVLSAPVPTSPAAPPNLFVGLTRTTSAFAGLPRAGTPTGPGPAGTQLAGLPVVPLPLAGLEPAGIPVAGRQFLAFDPAGDGTAVEAIGDLAAADRIAVLVPGVNTTLRDFDRGLGSVARRAPAVQARALYDGLRADRPQARVAVVAWLGYDTPDGIGVDSARESRAHEGARALRDFVRELHRLRPGAALTLVGHSYGAIVVGLAAPSLPEVGDLVALGAPGMGARQATDLGGARVWSALAEADWIRRIPQVRLLGLGHGRRPSTPAFGARPLPVGGVAGHDFYLTPCSPTLAAVARIVLGETP